MVEHAFHAHFRLQLVESHSRKAFENGVGLTRNLNAIYDVATLAIMLQHARDSREVVLQVGIDGYHHVGPMSCGEHSSHNGALMTHVSSQVNASHIMVFALMATYKLPCGICATIVHKHYHAFGRNVARTNQCVEQRR